MYWLKHHVTLSNRGRMAITVDTRIGDGRDQPDSHAYLPRHFVRKVKQQRSSLFGAHCNSAKSEDLDILLYGWDG
jgi:hypothetical protein